MKLSDYTVSDYISCFKRRKYYIAITWILFTTLSVVGAYFLPKTFRSTATLLMQAQIPAKLSESAGPLNADEQIQTIYQKVLTTDNILSIVNQHRLIDEIDEDVNTDNPAVSDIVSAFKGSTEAILSTTSLSDRNAKIADVVFDVSFIHENRYKAQAVVNDLVKLLIDFNDKARSQRAEKVTDFLLEELEKLNQKTQEIDNKIARYKEQNVQSLPEQVQANVLSIERTENELRDTESQIRSTKDRISLLETELARAKADFPVSQGEDDKPKTKEESLRQLQAKYAQLSSIYSENHPDIVRIKREIKALNSANDFTPSREDLTKQLEESKVKLREYEEIYKENHPEIIKQRAKVAGLEQQLKMAKPKATNESVVSTQSSNPSYIALEVQYKSNKSELDSLIQNQQYLKSKLEKLHATRSMGPKVEVEYADMMRERDSTVKKYNQLKEKWLDAKLVQSLEEQQRGQTLSIIEPAFLPIHPEKAIKKKVAIGGSFAGMIAGLGLALLLEMMDPVIRGYRAVISATELTPLIVIPYIESESEEQQRLAQANRLHWIKLGIMILFIIIFTAISIFYGMKLFSG